MLFEDRSKVFCALYAPYTADLHEYRAQVFLDPGTIYGYAEGDTVEEAVESALLKLWNGL